MASLFNYHDPDAGSYAPNFSSTSSDVAIAGELQESESSVEMDPNFNAELGFQTKEATFTIPIALCSHVSGFSEVELDVLYEVCDVQVLPAADNKIYCTYCIC